MPSGGLIRWRTLTAHFDVLLPGWELRVSDHRRYVMFGGQTARLPKGAHGRSNPEIHIFQVRHLFRVFGKLDEARKRIPQLH